MNKTKAISRISKATDKDDIVIAFFPCNKCDICHQPKDVLFYTRFNDELLECCGACSNKLTALKEILDDMLPEQCQEYIRQMM